MLRLPPEAPTADDGPLWWVSADGQACIPMHGAATEAEAEADLLEQCGTDEERARIRAGSFTNEGALEW